MDFRPARRLVAQPTLRPPRPFTHPRPALLTARSVPALRGARSQAVRPYLSFSRLAVATAPTNSRRTHARLPHLTFNLTHAHNAHTHKEGGGIKHHACSRTAGFWRRLLHVLDSFFMITNSAYRSSGRTWESAGRSSSRIAARSVAVQARSSFACPFRDRTSGSLGRCWHRTLARTPSSCSR